MPKLSYLLRVLVMNDAIIGDMFRLNFRPNDPNCHIKY